MTLFARENGCEALHARLAAVDPEAAEKKAEADLIRRQKDAEAKAYEMKQQAEALRAQAEAEKFAAEQKAAGIAAERPRMRCPGRQCSGMGSARVLAVQIVKTTHR